jgi:hypothetical protein
VRLELAVELCGEVFRPGIDLVQIEGVNRPSRSFPLEGRGGRWPR